MIPPLARVVQSLALPATFSVTGPESYLVGLRLGLGLAQVPCFHVEEDLPSGRLVEVLGDMPPPLRANLVALSSQPAALATRACVSRLGGRGVHHPEPVAGRRLTPAIHRYN
jgi:DNA-binding transcriptional LysR family regulator